MLLTLAIAVLYRATGGVLPPSVLLPLPLPLLLLLFFTWASDEDVWLDPLGVRGTAVPLPASRLVNPWIFQGLTTTFFATRPIVEGAPLGSKFRASITALIAGGCERAFLFLYKINL